MQYPSPDRPFAIKAINRIGGLGASLGIRLPGLDPDSLIARAQRETGLSDLGDDSFRVGLERLVEAIKSEAQLSQIGRIGAQANLVSELASRLRLVDHRARHIAVAQQKIVRPLFVLGLPRTGTTIFYELLAQDPAHRWPASWEVDEPVPPSRPESFDDDPRIERVEEKLGQVDMLAPEFKAMHEIGARLPQECVAIWGSQFWGDVYGAPYWIPTFRSWTLENGARAAYRWHHDFLQHMQSEHARERWVLKTPPHLAYLDDLVRQYPDAAIVWTHRDPMSVIGSVSSLSCTLRGAMSDHVDPLATGQKESEYFATLLQRGLDQRSAMPDAEKRFFDVSFSDIITNPVAIIEQMYEHFGFEFDDDLRKRMQSYLDSRPRDKHGRHQYRLEDFGLSEPKQGPLFGEYCRRYDDYLNRPTH